MKKILRFVFELLKRHPLPSFLTNIILMIRWRCYIHPQAAIGYPYNVKLGKYSRIGKCRIVGTPSIHGDAEDTVKLGDRIFIGDGVLIASQGGKVEIGDNVSIHDYSIIYGLGGVVVGRDTRIAAQSLIVSHQHQFEDRNKKIREMPSLGKGITIGEDCWIGAGVRILDGVTIGDGAIVGAGSVVTKDIPGNTIATGVPARFLKDRYPHGLD